MIKADFIRQNGEIVGFTVSGHAGYGRQGDDIVCAAVSSAAYMTANAITDCAKLPAQVQVQDDALLGVNCIHPQAKVLFDSFYLHMEGLASQYQSHITITNTEV